MTATERSRGFFHDFRDAILPHFGETQTKKIMTRMASNHVLMAEHATELTVSAFIEIQMFSALMGEIAGCLAKGKTPAKELLDHAVNAANSPEVEKEIKRFLVYRSPTTKTQ